MRAIAALLCASCASPAAPAVPPPAPVPTVAAPVSQPAVEPAPREPPPAESPEEDSPPEARRAPVKPVTLAVPGDNPIEVVLGAPDVGRAIVYLHGVCGDPFAFESWIEAASAHGTFISLRGDERCDDRPGRFKWSFDYARLDRRIRAALEAADVLRRDMVDSVAVKPLDPDDVALVGYSQGAHRVQWMAARYPDRYRRVALIALSTEPSPARLARAEKILIVAGGWDARTHLWEGHNALKKAGKTVLYKELPKARHGEYGPAAQETMAAALDWLFE
jgi:predicted esterase